jgi:hypothetical protein
MPEFYGVGHPNDTPPSNELPPLDAHAVGKDKKEQKNSMLMRTNSWCQHG